MYVHLFNFFVSAFLIVASVSYFINLSIKTKKLKQDILELEKAVLTAICFIIGILCVIYKGLEGENKTGELGDKFVVFVQFIYNIYIVCYFLIQFFLARECYKSYIDPNYKLISIINSSKSNIVYELIIIALTALIYIFTTKVLKNIYYNSSETFYDSGFILTDVYKWVIFLLISASILYYFLNTYKRINNFCFKERVKLLKILKIKVLSAVYYIFCNVAYGIVLVFVKVSGEEYKKEGQTIVNISTSFFYLILIIADYLVDIYILSTSKFSTSK